MSTDFLFLFDPSYRKAARLFGVHDGTALVTVTDTVLRARFGPWRVQTTLANVSSADITGPYQFIKTAGPARLSFSDRGLTFATNGTAGVLISFVEPVTGMDPWGRLKHPNLTLTVADPEGFRAAVRPLG